MIHEMRAEVRRVESARYARLDIRDDRHPLWIVSLVVEGRVEVASGEWADIAEPGEAMVHPPGVPFSERSDGPGLHEWGLFTLRAGDDLFAGLPGIVRPARDLVPLFRRLPSDPLALTALLEALREGVGRGPRGFAATGRFARLIAEMEAAPSAAWTRRRMADLAAMHPTAFDRAFRREIGHPPGRALLLARLRHARRRLAGGDESLGSIAAGCGFSDASNLSRAFRREYGVSPGAWRDSLTGTTVGYFSRSSDPSGAAN